jgi:hypothetical protein
VRADSRNGNDDGRKAGNSDANFLERTFAHGYASPRSMNRPVPT